MKVIFTSLFASIILSIFSTVAQIPGQKVIMDDCEKVQSLLSFVEEFKGPLINDNAYECKRDYILEGFKGARVIVPGKEAKYWTVNMNSEEIQQVEAESQYMQLIQQLMRCDYLNSWKGRESIVEDGIYHYNFNQSISKNGNYKTILVSYYKLKNTELYRVEITLTN